MNSAIDKKRFAAGGMVMAVGAYFFITSITSINIGTMERLGPGAFPAALSAILIVLGILIMVPAFYTPGPSPRIRIWSPLFVLAGVAGFALTIRPFGLLPAVLVVTLVSSFAELRVRPVSLFLLCATLCLMSWLIFGVGLRLPVPMFRWPF